MSGASSYKNQYPFWAHKLEFNSQLFQLDSDKKLPPGSLKIGGSVLEQNKKLFVYKKTV